LKEAIFKSGICRLDLGSGGTALRLVGSTNYFSYYPFTHSKNSKTLFLHGRIHSASPDAAWSFPSAPLIFVFETGSCCVAQADLELTVLLLKPSRYWDYRHRPTTLTLLKREIVIFRDNHLESFPCLIIIHINPDILGIWHQESLPD
jgi:hypothetical protein